MLPLGWEPPNTVGPDVKFGVSASSWRNASWHSSAAFYHNNYIVLLQRFRPQRDCYYDMPVKLSWCFAVYWVVVVVRPFLQLRQIVVVVLNVVVANSVDHRLRRYIFFASYFVFFASRRDAFCLPFVVFSLCAALYHVRRAAPVHFSCCCSSSWGLSVLTGLVWQMLTNFKCHGPCFQDWPWMTVRGAPRFHDAWASGS